jgi:hypothetical protein
MRARHTLERDKRGRHTRRPQCSPGRFAPSLREGRGFAPFAFPLACAGVSEAVRAWLVTDRAFRAPERLVSPAGGCQGKQEEGNNPSRAYPGGGRTWETSLGSAGSFFSLRRCGVAKAYQYGSENVIGPVQRVFVESAPLPISPYASVPRSGMLRR